MSAELAAAASAAAALRQQAIDFLRKKGGMCSQQGAISALGLLPQRDALRQAVAVYKEVAQLARVPRQDRPVLVLRPEHWGTEEGPAALQAPDGAPSRRAWTYLDTEGRPVAERGRAEAFREMGAAEAEAAGGGGGGESRQPFSRAEASSTVGSWAVAEDRRGDSPPRTASSSSAPAPGGRAATEKKAGGNAHSRKVAGVFGLSDSEDDLEGKTRREMERAERSKRAKLSASGREPTVAVLATSTPVAPSAGASSSAPMMTAEVHMKYAQWKMSCKNRYVPMPEDLKRAVAQVMGNRM
mmetsp:Transcript_38550/g.97809  ORF Transcript_38550/g.97809 Transcript_38550/m.97809 type:complete len:298 (+) Transcript_38550:2-895(+)